MSGSAGVTTSSSSFRVRTTPILLLFSVISLSFVANPAVAFHGGAPPAASGRPGRRSFVAVVAKAATIGDDIASPSDSTREINKRTAEELREKGWFVEGENLCFYRRADGNWKRRRLLSDLHVGQRLFATRLEGRDLLDGKTGPKVFFECGVGRLDRRGEWRIVNGMMRMGGTSGRGATKKKLKPTALAKRLRRLGGGGDDGGRGRLVPVYVSDVDLASGRLEVTEKREDALAAGEARETVKKKIPASSLKVGTELIGTVVRVEPYGALVDVGANRLGLLHIKTVADLFGRYVNKQRGMAEIAGIETRAKIRVSVTKNERRKMELDFTDDVKADVEAERMREAREKEKREGRERSEEVAKVASEVANSEDDAAAWAAFAAADDYDYEEDDEYDEDQEIEDALGISTY